MKKKTMILLAGMTLAPPLAPPLGAGMDAEALLRAIALVETANHNEAIGPGGERSAWQLTEATWGSYTTMRFEVASRNPVLAHRVAMQHLVTIVLRRRRRKLPVTAADVARAWNPGAPADYAERVQNLYQEEVGSHEAGRQGP